MNDMQEDDRDAMVLSQYTLLGRQHTTILCRMHSADLNLLLRQAGVGSGNTYAPALMRCDRCAH